MEGIDKIVNVLNVNELTKMLNQMGIKSGSFDTSEIKSANIEVITRSVSVSSDKTILDSRSESCCSSSTQLTEPVDEWTDIVDQLDEFLNVPVKKTSKKKLPPKAPKTKPAGLMCKKCNAAVMFPLTWGGAHFHRECFICNDCGKSLSGGGVCYSGTDDQAPYCTECYDDKYRDKCVCCSKPIVGNGWKYSDFSVHYTCLVCRAPGCGVQLSNVFQKFVEHDKTSFSCSRHMCGSDHDFRNLPTSWKWNDNHDKTKYECVDSWAKNTFVSSIDEFVCSFRQQFGQVISEELMYRTVYTYVCERIAYKKYHPRRSQQANDVIRTNEAVCEGYSNLFIALCRALGLEAYEVIGTTVNTDDKSDRKSHAYSAGKIGSKFYLFDCTWGAGSYNNGQFQKKFSDFFFMCNPEHLIYSHFPEQQKWQLLDSIYTWEEFLDLPQLKGTFFELGLSLLNHKTKSIEVPSGQSLAKIELEGPEEVVVTASLKNGNNDVSDCVFVHKHENSGRKTVYLSAPKGSYELVLFGRKCSDTGNPWDICSFSVTVGSTSITRLPVSTSLFDDVLGTLISPSPGQSVSRGRVNISVKFGNLATRCVCAVITNKLTGNQSERIPLQYHHQTYSFKKVLELPTDAPSQVQVYWATPGDYSGMMTEVLSFNSI